MQAPSASSSPRSSPSRGDRPRAAPPSQRAELTVCGSYFPQVVTLAAGVPTVLSVHRQEGSWCSEQLHIPELGVVVDLPCFERTEIELPALPVGCYEFTCGMEMLHGTLAVGESGVFSEP
ncbi:cupredoxin domain-containing protein [Georgenia muralis]|uniref:Cupredoxin-like protein n=1 Tax=Georgenia muralis TaxID=154117 RepID=A0A3N4Z7E4_9MICO|nr:cupredoxin domain-containing protein [Georgenia muralis]RPF28233.1 cupredoxin-like protein [Georgenia muralis]